jgi:hypothetical protein
MKNYLDGFGCTVKIETGYTQGGDTVVSTVETEYAACACTPMRINACVWLVAYIAHVATTAVNVHVQWPQRQTFLALLSAVMLSDIAALMGGDHQQDSGKFFPKRGK